MRTEALPVMSLLDRVVPVQVRFSEERKTLSNGWGCGDALKRRDSVQNYLRDVTTIS